MKNKKWRQGISFAQFVFPALAFVLIFADIPFFQGLIYSLFDWNGISSHKEFVGLENFVKVFTTDPFFWKSLKFTMRFALYNVVIVNVVALAIAMALTKQTKLSYAGRAFYYIPYIISLTAVSTIWRFILTTGFDSIYDFTGWEFFDWSWLGSPKLAFYVVVFVASWRGIGFYMVSYIAGILAVPRDVIEAARIDGASSKQVFLKVTLPLLMPSISVCLLQSLSNAFKTFDIIMVMTSGGPANSTITVAYDIYAEAFTRNNYGLATAKALVFVVILLVITLIQTKATKGREVEL